jgi:ribosomal protein S18 acetylase RimI-like enzyme
LDVAAIVAVINEAFEVEREFRRGERTSPAEIGGLLARDTFLVDEREGRVVAAVHVRATGDTGYFGMLAVLRGAQGSGIGRALLDEAERHCREAGCTRMTLSTGEDRKDIIPWYQRLGYRITKIEPSTSSAWSRPINVVHMEKPL